MICINSPPFIHTLLFLRPTLLSSLPLSRGRLMEYPITHCSESLRGGCWSLRVCARVCSCV